MMMRDTGGMVIEVRQHRDGSYTIHYPAEGWLPCVVGCDQRHKHEYDHPYVESYYRPIDLDDALEYAKWLGGGREVKVIKYLPLHKRLRKRGKGVEQ